MGKRRLGRGLSEFSTRCCIFPRGLAGAACSAQSTERRSRKLENRKWKISRQAKAARDIGSRVALRLTRCAAADLKGRCRQKARVGRDCQALMSRPASGEARQGGDPPSYTGRPYPFAGRSETLPAKMSRFRKYGRVAVVVVALIAVSQAAVALLLKTGRMRGYLVAQLETSFGRPVQVGQFSMRILPIPELNAEGVTIGEDPAFGHEYFLRAERMTARFRWLGLLEGHFEFGTMSLTRPSLILVRTAEGRWNLERWLPPAKPSGAFAAAVAGPQLPSERTHHLQKIEFDDGRINFKQGDEKKAFAFTNVSGNVEQVSPGRWELQLEAQPWRSGALLQSTGTLYVRGDVAGTSARLQPAEIQLHWEKVSIADLFRLVTGNDPGVRGTFALDGKASVGKANAGAESGPSQWRFELRARATRVHRWDLTERADNPRVNVNLKGFWDIGAGEARAEELTIEAPRSKIQGTAVWQTQASAERSVALESVAVRAEDLMAWYRAFHPGVVEETAVEGLVTGNATLGGWPLRLEECALKSEGATVRLPAVNAAGRIEPFRGSMHSGKFVLENVRLHLEANRAGRASDEKVDKTEGKTRPLANSDDTIETR